MTMKHAALRIVLCVAVALMAAPSLAQDAEPPAKKAGPAVVVDSQSMWRSFSVLKPPVVELDAGPTPLISGKIWLDTETPAAPADWTGLDFADVTWLRGPAKTFPRTAYLANLCLRAKFEVTDPAQVKDLKLSVTYYGGVVVYVNGREIKRANLPKGDVRPTALGVLADSYGLEAFVGEDGALVPANARGNQYQKALAARERTLADVVIPAESLRKGVNVLAIEVIRAPYHKVLGDPKYLPKNNEVRNPNCRYDFRWFTCELREVKLVAGSSSGLVPNASRPEGLQAWNSDLLATDLPSDYGDRCEPLQPVLIQGPRNGWSSGKVVLGSAKALEGLKVTLGDLKQGDAVIPAAQVRARYAVAFGRRAGDTLLEKPLASFPVESGGAVVPVWITVRVPRDAKPGLYAGQATIEATGEKAITVPIRLEVADFAVPDTQDYRTWIELMQSPDTLAARYETPLWSDRHWQLMTESMRYISEIGSRVVHIPLIAQSNYGNAESMVRWIRKADGTYDYDFTILDKYLDLAVKEMGKPKMVVFTAWEIYLKPPENEVKVDEGDTSGQAKEKGWAAARWNQRDKGPAITVLDPATGKTELAYLPRFEDPAAKTAWKPLFDALHKRMAARGIEDTMRLGMASDAWPSKAELTVLQEVSGDLPWIMHTHGGNRVGQKMQGIAPVSYIAYVWNTEYAKDVGQQGYGWKRPELYAEFRRFSALNDWPAATIMIFPELQITGIQRGVGRIGADFWPAIKDKRDQYTGRLWEKYPQSLWHSCNMYSHLLMPGPDGPVASARYEQMREGVQQCEARIAIERVLTDDALKAKLDADLAARCQKLLDDRIWENFKAFSDLQLTGRTFATADEWGYGVGGIPGHLWYTGSGWQARTQKLYELAGEVTKKLATK
jgi:hypothetical protein